MCSSDLIWAEGKPQAGLGEAFEGETRAGFIGGSKLDSVAGSAWAGFPGQSNRQRGVQLRVF